MFGNRSERASRRPTPPAQPIDDDATEVHTGWQNTMHRHLQAQSTPPPALQNPPHDATQVFPAIARPGPGYRYPNQPQASSTPPIDPTDIGALIHASQAHEPNINMRVLEYYGNPQIKNILVVAGYQIHKVGAEGVLITENGPNIRRTLIPWHRVHSFNYAPGDTIMAALM